MRHDLIYSLTSLASAVFGLLVLVLLSRSGLGPQELDQWFVCYALVNTLSVFFKSVFGAGLVARYHELKAQDPRLALESMLRSHGWVILASAVLAAGTIAFSQPLSAVLLPNTPESETVLASLLPGLAALLVFNASLTVPGAYLMAEQRMIAAGVSILPQSIAPLVYLLSVEEARLQDLSVAYAAGAGLAFFVQMGAGARLMTAARGLLASPATELAFLRRYLTFIGVDLVTRFLPLLERVVFAAIQPGSVIILEIAARVFQRPIGIVNSGPLASGGARYAEHLHAGRKDEALQEARRTLGVMIGLSLVAMMGLIGVAPLWLPMVSNGVVSLGAVLPVLVVYVPGVLMLCVLDFLRRALFAHLEVWSASLANLVQGLLNLLLLWLAIDLIGVLAVPAAFSVALLCSAALLSARWARAVGVPFSRELAGYGRVAFLALASSLPVLGAGVLVGERGIGFGTIAVAVAGSLTTIALLPFLLRLGGAGEAYERGLELFGLRRIGTREPDKETKRR